MADELIKVFDAQGESEAGLVRGLLASHGIESVTLADSVQSVYPLTFDGLGLVRIMVRPEDAEEARRVLRVSIEGYEEA
jgi:hypothetical protein